MPRRIWIRRPLRRRDGGGDAHRSPYGFASPLPCRAHISIRGPADTRPVLPSTWMASNASVRGDRPPSIVAMMTGHASSVDSKRASTLFDGINRIAPVELARVRPLIVRVGTGAGFIRVRSHGVRDSWRAMQ